MASLIGNPQFNDASRPAYELPRLLKKLPSAWHTQNTLSVTERQMADAAQSHASNAVNVLLRGLEAVGDVMQNAGSNLQMSVSNPTMCGLGELVSHIAIELEYLRETEQLMGDLIATPAPDAPKAKGGAK